MSFSCQPEPESAILPVMILLKLGLGGIMIGHAFIRCSRMILLFMLLYSCRAWPFKLGVENLSPSFFKALKRPDGSYLKVGLISNQTSVDQKGNRTVDILQRQGVRVLFLLAPEHGFTGTTPASAPIQDSVDERTGIPIKSIYGSGGDCTISGKRIKPELLEQLDAIVYDIQDCGMRHYTYISTLLCALESAAEAKKPIFVFDRPNLLGGSMAGPLVEPACKFFASIAPIPLRHGMTAGELARYFNTHLLKAPAPLTVISMKGYDRFKKTLFLAPLSPNIPQQQSVYGYSFLGLMGEIRPFCTGIGTQDSLQIMLIPDSSHFPLYEWNKAKKLLQTYGIQSCTYTTFHHGHPYTGLKMRFPSPATFNSFSLFLDLLDFFKEHGVSLVFSKYFDQLIGTSAVQKVYTEGQSRKELEEVINMALETFYKNALSSFLYKPVPKRVSS
jgi:uncharacterized protein YbbC (DUF1343 family)